ncbi:MAG: HEAT repeat domain-containing protein [Candidatus Nealsonbacteria bacterium]|nr:HEAT repeat domain-containing protein [Candidatus Nealsonbacteria bacterium]
MARKVGCISVGVVLAGIVWLFFPEKVYHGKTISQWAEQLHGGDRESQQEAADVLSTIGVDAIPALLEAAAADDTATRCMAIKALGPPMESCEFTASGMNCVTGIVPGKGRALDTLGRVFREAKTWLEHEDVDTRHAAVRLLVGRSWGGESTCSDGHSEAIDRACTAAGEFLATEDADVQAAMLEVLGASSRRAAVLPILTLLADEDRRIRRQAALALARVIAAAGVPPNADNRIAPAVPAIVGLLDERSPPDAASDATSAARALARIGSESSVRELIRRFSHPDVTIRDAIRTEFWRVLAARADGAEIVRRHVDDLAAVIRAHHGPRDAWTVDILLMAGAEGAAAVTALLKADDDALRRGVLRCLYLRGMPRFVSHAGPEGIALIKQALQEEERPLRYELLKCLALGNSERCEPFLDEFVEAVLDSGSEFRSAGHQGLRRIGPKGAEAALPRLLDALHGSNSAKCRAIEGLGHLGPVAAPAVPQLVPLLEDDDWRVRSAAATTLGWLQEPALDARDPLEDMKENDPHPEVREAADLAFKRIDLHAKSLQHRERRTRQIPVRANHRKSKAN